MADEHVQEPETESTDDDVELADEEAEDVKGGGGGTWSGPADRKAGSK